MPHLILECSDKLVSKIKFGQLFNHLHQYLADNLPTQVSSCKSRVTIREHYYIGDDFDNNLFIHLTLKILPGRSDELKNKVCTYIHTFLKNLMGEIDNTVITVELLELSPFYVK